ncbi:hypothetical protein ACFVYV_46875 [Streptomyces mirabilis]|uniref:hypothetical protein n=1 Tax=Streptomyces mirabilis TaxID=68239 RepID=UPI0036DD8A2D
MPDRVPGHPIARADEDAAFGGFFLAYGIDGLAVGLPGALCGAGCVLAGVIGDHARSPDLGAHGP